MLGLRSSTRPEPMSSTSLELSYSLALPDSITASTPSTTSAGAAADSESELLERSCTRTFAIDTSSPSAHLASLIDALDKARATSNAELTRWKDAAKDLPSERKLDPERAKHKGSKGADDDEEEDEDADEQDGEE